MQKERTEATKKCRKKPRISHFPGLALRVQNGGLKQGPEGSERWVSWALEIRWTGFSWFGVKACATESVKKSQKEAKI